MKKIVCEVLALFCFVISLFAIPSQSAQEFTLENGLSVFILEDTSTPLVRLELAVKAGFSSQTQNTSGFFKLYTRILNESLSPLKLDSADCNSDSSNYIITTTPQALPEVAEKISAAAFSPVFPDEILIEQLGNLKKEVRTQASDTGTFINSAIDSRVFSQAPWKHDSGVYPSLFARTTEKKARTILTTIANKYYTPQNSAIFITGNINTQKTVEMLNSTFGSYYSTAGNPVSKPLQPVNTKRKFIIHSPEFSNELTQVVMQYTSLDLEECDIAATILDNGYSYYKTSILQMPELNIPGDEYINAAAAHKRDSSRLIIQTLIQPPEDKKNKITAAEQTEKFIDQTKFSIANISMTEFFTGQQLQQYDFNNIETSSVIFMEKLSQFWALEPYSRFNETSLEIPQSSILIKNFLDKKERFNQVDYRLMVNKLAAEEPFIFVILNSNEYKKNKKAYTAAGFDEINTKNAPWYSQELFAKITDPNDSENYSVPFVNVSNEENFYQANINSIKKTQLNNGIPIITKLNPNSSGATLVLSINGGKLNSVNNNGFEEVMVSLLASNIQNEIYQQQMQGMIFGAASVDWESQFTTSSITIECEANDLVNVCKAISNGIIYADIIPSAADRAVSNRQYKKRLENGSSNRQLLCAAINELYPNEELRKIFDSKNDILQKTDYQSILEAYPKFLDASRYSLIITGNIPDSTAEILNSTLGLLSSFNSKIKLPEEQAKPNSKKNLKVKINHTFLTDIPAEKAGPMPAVLIPTTEFLDPVIFCFTSPAKGTKEEALFNSIFYYLEKNLQSEIDKTPRLKGAKVYYSPANSIYSTSALTIQNVPHLKELDAAYKNVLDTLKNDLQGNTAVKTMEDIKETWIKNEMGQTITNTGTATLLQKGLEYFPYQTIPEYYLNQYDFVLNGTNADFLNLVQSIPQTPEFKAYSAEAKN